tara:strand:+ start:104 stop:355 length:252 start_codon:yes stop_codon:yes gene_type:complete
MSWKNVSVKNGAKVQPAFLRGDELELANVLGDPKTVTVDGESRKVQSWTIDERDNIIKIKLEPLEGALKGKGEPDGESAESTS